MKHIDETDRKLISILREDGRSSVSTLANHLKTSRGTVQNRMARLERDGIIIGYSARLGADIDALSIRAITFVRINGRMLRTVITRLRGFAEIRALHTTNGEWDLIAEIIAPGLMDFDRLLREIRLIDGVADTQTSICLKSVY